MVVRLDDAIVKELQYDGFGVKLLATNPDFSVAIGQIFKTRNQAPPWGGLTVLSPGQELGPFADNGQEHGTIAVTVYR